MYEIITKIFESDLKTQLAFKWWTLCYFLYKLDRFSVDLDFDKVGNRDMEETIKKLEAIVKEYWKIDKITKTKLILNYESNQRNLKIEINDRIRNNNSYEIINFFWLDIKSMTKDCIFANKLVALSQRYKPRDLYDVNFFYSNMFPINYKIIEERTGKKYNEFLTEIKKWIKKNFNEKNIIQEMWELLTEKNKYFVKTKLIEKVLSYIDFESENYAKNEKN